MLPLQHDLFADPLSEQASNTARVSTCNSAYAKQALRLHHYLGDRMPAGIIDLHAVEEHDRAVGTIIWSNGPTPMIMGYHSAELARVALGDHSVPTTHFLSMSRALLRRRHPELQLLVSYADTAQGHEGIIYRADNWIYAGTCTTNNVTSPDGIVWHDHSIWSVHGPGHRVKLEPLGWVYGQSAKKHRFWYPLTRQARRHLIGLADIPDTPADLTEGH